MLKREDEREKKDEAKPKTAESKPELTDEQLAAVSAGRAAVVRETHSGRGPK